MTLKTEKEREQMSKPLHDLIDIIHFTEKVSTKIHGILDEAHIYKIIEEESAKSKYVVSILLLADDKSELKIVEAPVLPKKLKAAEKATGLHLKGFTIDLEKSTCYRQVVRGGKTVQVTVDDIVAELVPPSQAHTISEIFSYKGKPSILTPLKRHEKITGAVAISSTELTEYFIPSVKTLAQHISTALESSDEYARRKHAEKEKDKILHSLEERVKELSCLYKIDEITKRDAPLEEILKEIIQVIPPSLQYPEITGCCITFEDNQYKTGNFAQTEWMQKKDITVSGQKCGAVHVCHTRKPPEDEDPFSKEERDLIISIAKRLGEFFERKKGENALKKAEKKFRDLFDYAGDAIFIHDLGGHFLEVNHTACQRLGYTKEELLQMTPVDIDLPEYAALVRERIEELQKKGSLFFETAHLTKDGRKIPVELSSRIIEYEGTPAVLSIARDITERKQAEENLQQSELRYKTLFENVPVGVGTTSFDGQILISNDAMLEMTGYSKAELEHINVEEMYENPEDRNFLLSQVQEKGVVRDFEVLLKHKDGTSYCASLTVTSVTMGEKDVMLTMAKDITEQKKAEENLQKSEEKYKDLVENINDVIYIVDKEGVVTYVSPAVESFMGYTPSEVTGHHFSEFIYWEDLPRLRENFSTISSGNTTIGEYRALSKSGEIRWMRTSSRPHFTGESITGVQGVLMDITEWKQTEEALQKSEKQYRATIDSMGDAIHMVDSNLQIALFNKAFNKWNKELGLKTDVIGKSLFEIFSFLPEKVRDEYYQVFNTGKTLITEERTKIMDREFITETRKIPILEEGRIRRVVTIVRDITESKKAEEALRRSEEKFRTLFENQGIGMALGELDMSSTGTVTPVEFNAALLKFFGYTEEEFRTKTLAEVSHPEDLEKDIILLREALEKNRDSFEVEKRFIRKDGQVKWGHLTVSLLRNTHGYPTHIIASVQDITEQKLSEEAVRKSEEEFRLAFENAKDAIFWADPETGLVIRCNKAAEILLEKKREEIVGHHQTEVHLPQDAEYYEKVFCQHTEQKGAEDVEAEVITKSGVIKPVHISASLTMVGGNPVLQGIFRDITERKKAEEELQESEEKYRTLIEHSLQGIIIAQGTPLRLAFANTAAAEVSGYTVEELLSFSSGSIRHLVHPEDQPVFERYVARLKGKPVPMRYDFRIIRKDGEVRWLEIYASVIEYQGNPAVQVTFIDITERKQAEEKIKQSLREKEVLLREIHHRVKNNLQVVSSLLNLQSEHTKDEKYTEMLKESQNRIRSMALIHEKLYKSENLADIDFKEYIESLVHGLVRTYKTTDRVALKIDVKDISLGIDAAIPCGLIISELVSNSLKYAFPDREGDITITLHSSDGKVELVVADSGIGIPDTVDFKKTETLGLDLVTTLVEGQLNGSITLDKKGGTAFYITFEEVM